MRWRRTGVHAIKAGLAAGTFAIAAPATGAGGLSVYLCTDDGRLLQQSLDGGSPTEIGVRSIAVDETLALAPTTGRLFWTAGDPPKLYRSNLNGSDLRVLTCEGIEQPKWLTVSEELGFVYWTEPEAGEVRRIGIDGGPVETVIGGLVEPFAVSVDAVNRAMYLTGGWVSKSIYKMDLDGDLVASLMPGWFGTPKGVVAVPELNALYWIANGKVRRADLSGPPDVVNFPSPWVFAGSGLAVDASRGTVHRVSASSNILTSDEDGDHTVSSDLLPGLERGLAADPVSGDLFVTQPGLALWRTTIATQQAHVVLQPHLAEPVWAIDVDPIGRRLVWAEQGTTSAFVRVLDLERGISSIINLPSASTFHDVVAPAGEDAAYLCGTSSIVRVDLESGAFEVLFDAPHFVVALDRHTKTGRWWWIAAEQFLYRSEADGSEQTVFGVLEGLADDLVIDELGGVVYWLEFAPAERLMRSSLDTFAPQIALEGIAAGSRLQLDAASRTLYWTDGSGSLWSWPIDQPSARPVAAPPVTAGFAVGPSLDPLALADLNGDGSVDGGDLGVVLASWGPCSCPSPCQGDASGDGVVDGADLGVVLARWSG
jgi:hypothetical protein